MTTSNTTTLHPKLDAKLKVLDKKLNLLLEELKVYSDDQLNRKPGAKEWSVIQVMHHLMLVESGSQRYLEKKLSFNPELKNKTPITAFRKFLCWVSLNSPIKFKAPEGVSGQNLPDYVGFWEEVKQWKEQRVKFRQFLSSLPDELMQKEVYKHPFAGRLSLEGMLDFIIYHFDRHHKQIRSIIKHFPKQN